jgi:hypothetical protein
MPTYTLTAAQLYGQGILNSFSIPAASTAPVNTVAPVLSGTNLVGQTLTSSTGSWTGVSPITFGYQWKRNSINISNATASAYVTVQGDLSQSILCLVTATDSQGSASASSNSVTINQIPTNTVAPVISGTQTVGQTLTATNGTWVGTPTITFTYQWKRNGSNIGGATSSTYLLVSADQGGGTTIQCVVTGTNGIGNSNANSNTLTGIGTVPTVSDADAQSFLNAAGISNTTQANAVNSLVIGLKADGIWTGMKAIYPFVGGTASTHKYNLKDPRDLDAAYRLQFNGGITHDANGALPNGINGYADTYLNPSLALSNNSIHFSVYMRNFIPYNANDIGVEIWEGDYEEGVPGPKNLINRNYNDQFFYANGGTNESGIASITSFLGNFLTTRTDASQVRAFQNGTLKGSLTAASNNSYFNMYLMGINYVYTYLGSFLQPGTSQMSFATIGDGLTNPQVANLNTRIQTFQTSLSRQV